MPTFNLSDVLDSGWVYSLWQFPFANLKMSPLLRHNEVGAWKSVLDVACGPGINYRYFRHTNYFGFDLNPNYINTAIRKFGAKFAVANALEFVAPGERVPFEHILANSFFHHLTDQETLQVLSRLRPCLSQDGHIHILDLVVPDKPCLGTWLANHDRGKHPRSISAWQSIFNEVYDEVLFEPFKLTRIGVDLWQMVYFKGRLK